MKIDGGISLLTEKVVNPYTVRIFRKVAYSWFLLNTLILLPAANEFWSANALILPANNEQMNKYSFLYLLKMSSFASYYKIFIFCQIILLVLAILCVSPRLVSTLVYFFTMNLDNKAYVILDGGNNLMQLVLIYLIFMDPSLKPNKFNNRYLNYVSNSVSNLAFYTVRLQIVIVYAVSGLAKVAGTLWQNGTALYYTLNIDEYSHPVAKALVTRNPFFSVIGTYATLVYQLSFPWLVWNKKARPYFLTFGTLIHIQISFVMGLFMFGLAIATSYFSFMTNVTAKRMLNYRFTILNRTRLVNKIQTIFRF